jgi:hypothetical protein
LALRTGHSNAHKPLVILTRIQCGMNRTEVGMNLCGGSAYIFGCQFGLTSIFLFTPLKSRVDFVDG